jgi:hypothetical protein
MKLADLSFKRAAGDPLRATTRPCWSCRAPHALLKIPGNGVENHFIMLKMPLANRTLFFWCRAGA